MRKAVIPIEGDYLSKSIIDCSSFQIYEIGNDERIVSVNEIPSDRITGNLIKFVTDSGITDLIVHKIDKAFLNRISKSKINLFVGVDIRKPEYLINEYLHGTLKSKILGAAADDDKTK